MGNVQSATSWTWHTTLRRWRLWLLLLLLLLILLMLHGGGDVCARRVRDWGGFGVIGVGGCAIPNDCVDRLIGMILCVRTG